jgi:tetratricopeptide (TPR) repeat protein
MSSSSHFQRAQVLADRQRYDQAIKELHQALASEPDFDSAHALLAVCLSNLQQPEAALMEINQAIGLDPNYSGFHYIQAGILRDLERMGEARSAITEALRLDPEDADCHARLAAMQHDQGEFDATVKSAEQGLQSDAEHIGCMNLRLLGLVKLSRLDEAEADGQAALAKAPENPFSHMVLGWVALHRSRIPSALDSFREALRLQPDSAWAREGLIEALKARNGIYRLILQFDLWQTRLTTRQRVVFTGLLIIPQVRALYLLFIFAVSLSKPVFTYLLSLDPYGRLTLTQDEIMASRWATAGLGAGIMGILISIIAQSIGWLFLPIALWMLGFGGWKLRDGHGTAAKLLGAGVLAGGVAGAIIAVAAISQEAALLQGGAVLLGIVALLAGLAIVGLFFGAIGLVLVKIVQGFTQPLPARPGSSAKNDDD